MSDQHNTSVIAFPMHVDWSSQRDNLAETIKQYCDKAAENVKQAAPCNVHLLGFVYSFSISEKDLFWRMLDIKTVEHLFEKPSFVASPNALRAVISHELRMSMPDPRVNHWSILAIFVFSGRGLSMARVKRLANQYEYIDYVAYMDSMRSWRLRSVDSQANTSFTVGERGDSAPEKIIQHNNFISAIGRYCRDTPALQEIQSAG